MKEQCLFSAPFSFMPEIQAAYCAIVPTIFREIWEKVEITKDSLITAWVMNPGQKFIIDRDVLSHFENLKVLVTPSTGKTHIDLEACSSLGIALYSLLDDRQATESISASAEFTFLLILNCLRRLDTAVKETSSRNWRRFEDSIRGKELKGKKVGLIGFGRNGLRLAQFCQCFQAEVTYHDPYVKSSKFLSSSLIEIFDESDIVCICCSLTSETTGMINESLLKKLKKGACLINSSRGEVIDENDLYALLCERDDLQIGLDVLADESSGGHLSSPLLKFHDTGRIVITPHIAGATVESQSKAANIALALLESYLENRVGT